MVFHWSVSDCKIPQVSRTLLNILADLNNAVIWMVWACPLISNSSSPFSKPLEIFPSAPITIDITATIAFHRSLLFCFFCFFFQFSCKILELVFLFVLFNFPSAETAKFTVRQVLFFFLLGYYKVWYFGRG